MPEKNTNLELDMCFDVIDHCCESMVIDLGALLIIPFQRLAYFRNKPLLLTQDEFDLLVILARYAGYIVGRDQLQRELRRNALRLFRHELDRWINQIRIKMGDNVKAPRWLKAVGGAGYMLVPLVR